VFNANIKLKKEMMERITESAAQFTEGARVVSESSQSLAEGAQTQSAAVEEMSASTEQLTRSIDSVKEVSVIPTRTGTRPRAKPSVRRTISWRRRWLRLGASPVVPRAKRHFRQ
jgi:hypothetical protein